MRLRVLIAVVIGLFMAFLVREITTPGRVGGDGSFDCPQSIVGDLVHPQHARAHYEGFDEGPPCHHDAVEQSVGWGVLLLGVGAVVVIVPRVVPSRRPRDAKLG